MMSSLFAFTTKVLNAVEGHTICAKGGADKTASHVEYSIV